MKPALLFSFLFFSVVTTAQHWSALNKEFMDLYNKDDFDKAISVGEKAKLAAQKEFGEQHANYALSLYNLAGAYLGNSNYKKAEPLYLQARAIQLKVLGKSNEDYASTISDLATLYLETKQYEKAEPLYLEAQKISEQVSGTGNEEYITILENLAVLYEETKRYDKAAPLYREVVKFYKQHPNETGQDYASSLNSLAALYDKAGNYADAVEQYLLLAEVYKQQVGEQSSEFAFAINRIALLYTAMGEYEKAEPLYFQNAAIRKLVFGEKHPDYASALNNIAAHYLDLGQYEKAIPYYQQATDIAAAYIATGNLDYLTYVNNFALLYLQMGKYDIAEPLLIKIVEVKKKLIGENDPSYATSLNNLAVIYFKTGQYEKAVPVYTAALTVIKKTIGEQTPDYASSLSNLALLYATMGQTAKAEPLYLQAKTIREKMGGQNHPDYAALLDNLALLYATTGKPAQTKALYMQAKNIRKKLFGENHPDYAVSLNNLAYYYMDTEQYDSAELLFIQAGDIMKKTLGEDHPSYGAALNNLSDLYIRTGNYKKAEPGLLRSSKIITESIRNTFTVLSENEKNNYLENNTAVVETSNSFLFRYPQASKEIVINNFNLQLVLKSASLSDTKNMIASLLNSPDSNIRQQFSAWTASRNLLAKQYALPAASRRKDLAEIEKNTETMEKELNLASSDFRNQQTGLQVSAKELQKHLQADEVAIEFVRFRLVQTRGKDSILYAAYILHKDTAAPDFIPLCEERELQNIFDSAGRTATGMVSKLYRGLDGTSARTGTLGQELYKLIWRPLEPYLKGVKKISYAPAGKLYTIAFHALPADSVTILADQYQLQQYTSTKQLAFRDDSTDKKDTGTIVLFGNARFSMDSLQLVQQRKLQTALPEISTTSSFRGIKTRGYGSWNDLPGTGAEVNRIKQLFEENRKSTTVFTDLSASEEEFKKLSGHSPDLLHIATHGFFLPDPATLKKTTLSTGTNNNIAADNPLLRCGLILAGANYVWSGKQPIEGIEDGIVTAYEISQLNLSHTGLLVLSACETALGDIKGTEGVFGLQRAFKMAGVKRMIVSLWQVPDRETAVLMSLFYANLIKGIPTAAAFTMAQAEMRKKYAPYYWAAFVLVE